MRKFFTMLLQCVIVIGMVGVSTPAHVSAETAEPSIVIFYTGEYYGNLENTGTEIGMDVVSAIVKTQKEKTPATFLLDGGDAIHGTFFTNYTKGQSAIEIMNAAGYDAMTLGNHEFDFGFAQLLELARNAKFPMLTQPTVFAENDPLLHMVMLERGGYKIGVFGLTTPATKQISSAGEIDFGSPSTLIDHAQEAARTLRENGADVVICLSHIGNSDNLGRDSGSVMDIAETVLGIDVIIEGHSEDEADQSNAHTPVLFTEGSDSVGVIKIYDQQGEFNIETEVIRKSDTDRVEPDATTTKVIEKWREKIDKVGKEVIGVSAASLQDFEKPVIRAKESAIGNLVADALRETSGTEIAFINGGNIRAPLNIGDVTWSDVNSILPFSNYILATKVKGSIIRETLEHSAELRGTEHAGGFMQVSGLTYTINPNNPTGEKVTEITVGGQSLDDEKEYSLALPDFIANGGDGYTMLQEPFADAVSKGDVTASFAEYIKKNGDQVTKELEGRIVIDENSVSSQINQKSPMLWICIALGAIGIIAVFYVFRRKRNQEEK